MTAHLDIEVEQRPRLAPRSRHDEVVEGVGLGNDDHHYHYHHDHYLGDDEVLLDVHQLVTRHSLQLGELAPDVVQNLEV